ncbi:MAG TPA: DHH family phosphoesterase [Spirochaetota bacterium]|nr:DHH family phosphoesterase [Spirochaetota bacterium]HPI89455.1 DHH family phosphoesterase [Spirochaetota bacterium]HPR46877.1 DHH family phosphoesterase [Spirochaetota bacterium]
MKKSNIFFNYQKNRIIDAIIRVFAERNTFLILGHQNPDEDCISSMVGIALIIKKFNKNAVLFLSAKLHDHFEYLINICDYNSVKILTDDTLAGRIQESEPIDSIIVCDTAKPSMIQSHPIIDGLMKKDDILRIEIDHHLGGDSSYFGDPGYRLVSDATSASELVGQLLLRLSKKRSLLREFHMGNPFSRNLILAILTGIVGDTSMGKYLKSRKTKKYYRIFTSLYSSLLTRETIKKTNFSKIEDIYGELSRLSTEEDLWYKFMISKKKFSDSIGYVVLDPADTVLPQLPFDNEVIVSVARAVADELAEESGRLSLIAYYDHPDISDFIQLRVRRSQNYKEFDLRKILELFAIENGGGHEGAIGFRIEKDLVSSLDNYVTDLINGIEKALT